MKNLSFCFIIGLLFLACKSNENTSEIETSTNETDTLFKPSTYLTKDSNCSKIVNSYRKKYTKYLSNFYIYGKDLSFNQADSVVILKPFYTNENSFADCFPEDPSENVLLIYNRAENKTHIYKNALYVENPDTFQEIIPNQNGGFTISIEKGNTSKFFSQVKVNYQFKNLFVDSIVAIESWGFRQYKKKYGFKNLKLEDFSTHLIDSLQLINDKLKKQK